MDSGKEMQHLSKWGMWPPLTGNYDICFLLQRVPPKRKNPLRTSPGPLLNRLAEFMRAKAFLHSQHKQVLGPYAAPGRSRTIFQFVLDLRTDRPMIPLPNDLNGLQSVPFPMHDKAPLHRSFALPVLTQLPRAAADKVDAGRLVSAEVCVAGSHPGVNSRLATI